MTRWNKTVATMCTLHFSTLFLNIIDCVYCDFKRVTCPKPERQHNLHVGDIVNIAFYSCKNRRATVFLKIDLSTGL